MPQVCHYGQRAAIGKQLGESGEGKQALQDARAILTHALVLITTLTKAMVKSDIAVFVTSHVNSVVDNAAFGLVAATFQELHFFHRVRSFRGLHVSHDDGRLAFDRGDEAMAILDRFQTKMGGE